MIEPILTGRFGNFMFEVAAAYAYSLRHKCEYNIPRTGNGVSEGTIEKYLSWFPNIHASNPLNKNVLIWSEPSHAYHPIPYCENLRIQHYFQSEKYFSDFKKEVVALFNLPAQIKKDRKSHV